MKDGLTKFNDFRPSSADLEKRLLSEPTHSPGRRRSGYVTRPREVIEIARHHADELHTGGEGALFALSLDHARDLNAGNRTASGG